jgi:chromosome segregation protein
MEIKKLSILGFKSFMDNLSIDFTPGIMGIVGPNGCGKSNIVDAMRWCLGEQSPKQLRGRQMEDVIFGGTGGFKALGMAEVSMLFENGYGEIAGLFSQSPEICITRRLYRSGESEYLMNKVPCRLKDIQELFMDTGLGNRSYSIIGQGRIGAILEQRPEETRVMLEEAAGITKYRKKVEISQRKMAQTESNLQRVEDILGEIQRQMQSLKRQAAKTRRYKAITEEIRRLEMTRDANTYGQLKETSGARDKSTEDLLQKEMAKTNELSSLQARLESIGLELDEKDENLGNLRRTYERLLERVHKKESHMEALTGEIRMQKDMELRLLQEKGELGKRLSHLGEERDSLETRIHDMGTTFEDLEAGISISEERCSGRRNFLREIQEEYEKARAAVSRGLSQETGLNHESEYLTRVLGEITDSRSRLDGERLEVAAKIEKVAKVSETKLAARDAAGRHLRDIDSHMEQKGLKHETMLGTRDKLQAELRSAETELSVCHSRLSGLETLTANFEGYQQGVRTIMKAKDLEPRRQGRIMGLVADVLQVDTKYELAVEAILADQLQYVIVETQEDGMLAVDYLKGSASGRSSFVPLRELNGNGNANSGQHGHHPLLRDLITVPQDYRKVTHALLGDTMVVDNLKEALSAWRGNGRNQCLVTLEGDMVDQRGIISGGKMARGSRGLLARKREIRELTEKRSSCEFQVSKLQEKLIRVEKEIEKEKRSLEELKEERWTSQEEINEFDKMIFRLGQELDNLENLSQRITRELAAKDTEEEKQKHRLSEIAETLKECAANRQKGEGYLLEKERELKECEEEYDGMKEDLARLKADYRILQEEQRGLLREKQRLAEYMEESGQRLEKVKEDINGGRDRVAACETKKETLREELTLLSERLEASQEDLNGAERERQGLQTRIRELEGLSRELRDEIGTLKEDINHARMEASEIRFKMEGLVGRVRERFQMDLGEVYEQFLEENFQAADTERALERQKELRQRLGEVNLSAIKEHDALKDRHDFIQAQREDLLSSIETLKKAIRKINKTSLEKFQETFEKVDRKLKEIFPILFNGGTASLKLTDEANPLESGVLVEVRPPGKKLSHMGLLSGGEKALVAMALLFAIYMIKPSPFCLLDEVDAPLDEANIDRFNDLLKEIKRYSQIIMVTHNRRTMEIANRLYGVTMEKKGVSKIVAVDLNGRHPEEGADGQVVQEETRRIVQHAN